MVALKGVRIVRLRVGPVAPGRRVQRGSRAGMLGARNNRVGKRKSAASGLPMRHRSLSPSWGRGERAPENGAISRAPVQRTSAARMARARRLRVNCET